MEQGYFAALVARLGHGLAVYGPFASRTEARLGADWAGATSSGVVVTRPIALFPPDPGLLSTVDGVRGGEVVRLPEEVASLAATRHADPAGEDDPGAVVVLVVLAAATNPALLVGPFDSATDALAWCGRTGNPGAGRSAQCYVLPLRPSQLGTDGLSDTEVGDRRVPAVVLLDTDDDAAVVYGLFGSGMDAALFWHDFTQVIRLTNVRQVHVCELAAPAGGLAPAAEDDPTGVRAGGGWVVRLAANDSGDPRLVGPFDDEPSARTWCTEHHAATATPLPIRTP